MANLDQMGKILGPFLHYLKKMELELTCLSCSMVLHRPMVLPCSHVVCSHCIVADNESECKCPLCERTSLCGDLRPFMLMEKMIGIFESLHDAITFTAQKFGPQHLAGHNGIVRNVQGPRVDNSSNTETLSASVGQKAPTTRSYQNISEEKLEGVMKKVTPRGHPLPGNIDMKEEMASNVFRELRNSLQLDTHVRGDVTSPMPNVRGGSGGLATFGSKSCKHDAGKGTHLDPRQPQSPPPLHDFKEHDNANDQIGSHCLESLSGEGIEKTVRRICVDTKKDRFPQGSRIPNDANGCISVSSSETDDNAREEKRQKLDSDQGSDCNSKPCCSSDHAYPKETVKCAFCRSTAITESSGPMLHYVDGRPVRKEEINLPKVKHVHETCFVWAPQAFFEGEVARNLDNELARASKIKCRKCKRKGAALGCYVKSCWRSYHVPCAVELPGCRWDYENFNLLCPCHSYCKFQNEIVQLKWAIKAKRSSRLHDKSKPWQARKAKCSSTQMERSTLPRPPCTPEEQKDALWAAKPGVCSQWVLCGSDLSTSEMALLNKFASLTGASVTGKWIANVTHLIASTNECGACNRTLKFLMAILNGKWVLTIDWVKASLVARSPVSEEAFEINCDYYGICDGPKKGRIRAIQKAGNIFSGLSFYFTDQFELHSRHSLEEVVLAGGGTVMKNLDLVMDASDSKVFSVGSAFIVYNEDPPSQMGDSVDLEEIVRERCNEVGALEAKTGFKVLGHMRLLDHIAACRSAAELERAVVQCQ